MVVCLKTSALAERQVTRDPVSVEIRDDSGELLRLILILKGQSAMLTVSKGDPTFESVAAQSRIPLKIDITP